MLAVQLSPSSVSSFPYLSTSSPHLSSLHTPRRAPSSSLPSKDHLARIDMPSRPSTSDQPRQATSVFNALGSYADRIKDANGQPIITSPPSETQTLSSSSMTTTASSSRSRSGKGGGGDNGKVQKEQQTPAVEDDGPWETVQSSRQRTKNEEKEKKSAANTSRNWRERPQKDANGGTSSNGKEEEASTSKRSTSRASKKNAPNSNSTANGAQLASSTVAEKDKEKIVPKPSVSVPAKPAWGAVAPVSAAPIASSPSTHAAPATTKTEASKSKNASSSSKQSGQTTPPSSSTDTTAVNTSVGSPNLSATTDTSSVTTVNKAEQEEEGSWRSRPQDDKAKEGVKQKETQPVKSIAPAPAVNPWDLRKKTLESTPATTVSAESGNNGTASSSTPTPTTSAPSHTSSTQMNGPVAEGSSQNKKKKKALAEAGPAVVADPSLWPDIAQAAEVAKKGDDKKKEVKEKKEAEEESAAGEAPTVTSRKHKWKTIPAAELQAFSDEQAENARRQQAAKKRMAKIEAGAAVSGKPKARKGSVERGKPVGGINGEARLPVSAAANKNQVPRQVDTERAEEVQSEGVKDKAIVNGAPSSPHATEQGKALPTSSSQVTSPSRIVNHLDGPSPQSKSTAGVAGAPVPTNYAHVNGTGAHTVPRPPRGRDARGSFSTRGRGAYRGGMMKGFTSPVAPQNGLPGVAGGYGMNYGFYPATNSTSAAGLAQYGQAGQNYDTLQAQYMQVYSRGAPPPPMPQTVVANIDPHRFYVLGQYYFSMQNLAMDFFLRQQMDSEGWIDISMIASFNRLRSLTPDVSMVKEVMEMSNLLEVREDKVRLAGHESKKWVLPSAPISTFPPDPVSSPKESTVDEQQSQLSEDHKEISDMALELAGLDAPLYTHAPGGVENALMKTVLPPSSAASVSNGEVGNESLDKIDETDDTPATSMSGDDIAKVELR